MTTLSEHAYTAWLLGPGGDIPLSWGEGAPGDVTLDASAIPHVQGSITIAVEDAMLLEQLDPRDSRRVAISVIASHPNATRSRTFDLGVRVASPDRAGGTVTLTLASDEALLGDYAQLVDDAAPRQHEASLRAVCDYVLGKIGAQLEPGALDADVTAYWSLTNLVSNPSIEINADGWTAGANASALSRQPVTFDPPSGFGLRWNTGAAGMSYVDYAAAQGIRVTGGRWYVLSGHMICVASSQGHARVHFKNEQGVTVAQASGATIPVTGAGWSRPFVIVQAPPAATTASIHFGFLATAANQQPYVDAVMFHEGREVVPYMDGSTVDSATYDYTWSAAVHASPSTRTPVVERSPESLTWRAGVSGMAFLEPLLKAAGLRLVCDEQRRWTLRDVDWRADGNQTYRYGANIETAEETLSRDDDAWFDAAVYEYVWTDRDGIEQRRVDAFALADDPTKVFRVEVRDTPYPGPGRAEHIVRRAQSRGRTVTVSAIPTWLEHTDQTLSVLLEGTPIQTGLAGSVRFDFGSDTVSVTSRTTDTPAAAWILIPAGERWIDSPPGESWTEEVI